MSVHISKADAIAQARIDFLNSIDEYDDDRPVCPWCGKLMVSVAYYDRDAGWLHFWKCDCLRPGMSDDGQPQAEVTVADGYRKRAQRINRVLRKFGIEIYEP